MNANRTYTNNKCSEIAKDSRCWGQTYELHTPVLENLSIHDTSTHGTHTGLKATTGNTCLSSVWTISVPLSNLARCSLLHSRHKPQQQPCNVAVIEDIHGMIDDIAWSRRVLLVESSVCIDEIHFVPVVIPTRLIRTSSCEWGKKPKPKSDIRRSAPILTWHAHWTTRYLSSVPEY